MKNDIQTRISEITEFYQRRMNGLARFINLISEYRKIPKEENIDNHNIIPDLALSIALFQMDMEICRKHLLIYRELGNTYEKSYFTRALTMHLTDALDGSDKQKMIARTKEIAKTYHTNEQTSSLAKRLNSHVKALNEIKKNNIRKLSEIRNNIFTHRDGKGIEQFDAIITVEVDKIAIISSDVLEIYESIIEDTITIYNTLYRI